MQERAFEALWGLTAGEADALERVRDEGPREVLPSAFAVTEAATQTVAAASLAAAEYHAARGGPQQLVTVDRAHAAAAFAAAQLLRVDGEPVPAWAPISGTYEARDGRFVQLHCNFPHHEAGVAAYLGVPAEREAVAAAVAGCDAFELETALVERGLVAAACRTLAEWETHPHAQSTSGLPLLDLERIGDAEATRRDAGARPLEGVRVLDCSRVLAGPVGGQTLASHGAEVLRVGAAHLPTVPGGIRSTGFGKRNTDIDLRSAAGRATFARLAAEADVVIDAYRPGALAGLGFSAERLAELRPGVVVVELCAFDWVGPWGGRRGFDSIVQSTTGIAMAGAEAGGSARPLPLPVQALDYATGFLAAYAAVRGLHRQAIEGGSWRARVALLRTRNWLVSLGAGELDVERPSFEEYLHEVDSDFGRLRAVRAAGDLPETPPYWERTPAAMGSSAPEWLPR